MNGRAVAGTLLAVVGTVLAVAGPRALLELAHWTIRHSGVLLLGLAAVVMLRVAVPAGKRKWPALPAGAGLALLLLQQNVDPALIAGGGLVVLGALVSAMQLRSAFSGDLIDPVHTYRRVGYGRRIAASAGNILPKQIRLLSVFAQTELDLKDAEANYDTALLEVFVSCWFSRVKIVLPCNWVAVAGRVEATKCVGFSGELNSTALFAHPELREFSEQLDVLVDQVKMADESAGGEIVRVVIHVTGVFGRIVLDR